MSLQLALQNESDTECLGTSLADHLRTGMVCYFRGPLGAGKTTLVRALLRGLGVTGAIKSPSFALIEPYETNLGFLYHVDLYRLKTPEEIETLGLRDYLTQDSICLVEWPEKGLGFLPSPDLDFNLEYQGNSRSVTVSASSSLGDLIVSLLKKEYE